MVFRVYRDTATRDGAVPVPRGIYVADVDGSEWRQIVGTNEVAPLLGVPVDQVSFFGSTFGLDASTDGSRIVFAMFNAPESGGLGQSLMTVNADGSGLADLFGRVAFVQNGAISGDGATVAYVMLEDYASGIEEAGVVAFGGGDRFKLTDNTRTASGIGMSLPTGERIQLNQDGTRLLLGYTGLLYDTTDGTVVQLGVRGGYWSTDPAPLVANDLARPSMTSDAARFLYLPLDDRNVYQLATLDFDPVDFGVAPVLSDLQIAPASITAVTDETATITAVVASDEPLVRVGFAVLADGRIDPPSGPGVLVDDGAGADTAAGDDVHSALFAASSSDVVPGPRTVRVKAENRGADGRRHATSVDLAGLTIAESGAA